MSPGGTRRMPVEAFLVGNRRTQRNRTRSHVGSSFPELPTRQKLRLRQTRRAQVSGNLDRHGRRAHCARRGPAHKRGACCCRVGLGESASPARPEERLVGRPSTIRRPCAFPRTTWRTCRRSTTCARRRPTGGEPQRLCLARHRRCSGAGRCLIHPAAQTDRKRFGLRREKKSRRDTPVRCAARRTGACRNQKVKLRGRRLRRLYDTRRRRARLRLPDRRRSGGRRRNRYDRRAGATHQKRRRFAKARFTKRALRNAAHARPACWSAPPPCSTPIPIRPSPRSGMRSAGCSAVALAIPRSSKR